MAVLKAKLVESALRKYRGNMAAVGRKFGVTREAVRQFVASRPALKAVCSDCREAMTDAAESALFKAVRKGEAWAVCFYLKCQAKERGYIEKPADEKPQDKSEGVPVELLTRILAAIGSREPVPHAGGRSGDPGGDAVGTEPRSPEPGISEPGG